MRFKLPIKGWRPLAAAFVLAANVGDLGPASAQKLQPSPPAEAQSIVVSSKPVSRFQASNPGRTEFGKLRFLGGLVLTGNSSAFGGWSGITIDRDGRSFLAVSDEGSWLSGKITYKGSAPSGIVDARIGPIRALRGRRLDKKRDLDAEAVTLLDGSLARGHVLIGFERNHRIGVFPVVDGAISAPVRYLPLNAEIRRMRPNKGLEAVTVLKGGPLSGSVIAFSERYPGDPSLHTGWLWTKGQPERVSLTDIGGFEITDAVSLDDGRLLVLERRFRWTEGVKMRIRLVPAADIRPGGKLEGQILIEADLSFEIDNMEGLAVHHGADGTTVLTLISDDNFNSFLQRTLLLQFALTGERRAATARR